MVPPIQSPSGDAFACATLAAPSNETNSMKKPHLGWGEGMEKYEKKKVEGPDDSATKNGMVVCVNIEPLHSNGSILSDKSLRFTAFSACASPGTPSSVACRSSPGPSSSLSECQAKPCEDLVVNTGGSLFPAPLQLVSSGDMIAKEATGWLEEGHGQLKDEYIGSPGTVTSKFVEPHRSVNAAAMAESVKHGGSNLDLDASKPSNQEVTCSAYGSNGEKEECFSDCDSGDQLMARKSCAAPVGVSLHCAREDKLYNLILASNIDSASEASDVFNKLFPSDRCHVDLLRASIVSSPHNDPIIQEKFATKKQFVRFKLRVITLKFRAFQHLWKEDMLLLFMRKHHAKSQKRLELSSCTTHNYQKYHSSICSCFSSPGMNLHCSVPKFVQGKN